jgi:hypothetical protein
MFFVTGLMAANGFQCLDGNIQHASAERDNNAGKF